MLYSIATSNIRSSCDTSGATTRVSWTQYTRIASRWILKTSSSTNLHCSKTGRIAVTAKYAITLRITREKEAVSCDWRRKSGRHHVWEGAPYNCVRETWVVGEGKGDRQCATNGVLSIDAVKGLICRNIWIWMVNFWWNRMVVRSQVLRWYRFTESVFV